jgi:hypothetical protein
MLDSYPCAFGLRKNGHLERIPRAIGLSAFGSNLGIQHTSGSGEDGHGYLVFSSLSQSFHHSVNIHICQPTFVVWRNVPTTLRTFNREHLHVPTTSDAPYRRDSHHCRSCRTTALRLQAFTGLDRARENPPELFQLRGSVFVPKGMPQRSGKVWRHLFLTMQVGRQCPMGRVQTDGASQQAMNRNGCRTAAIGGEKSLSHSLRSVSVMASDIKFPP